MIQTPASPSSSTEKSGEQSDCCENTDRELYSEPHSDHWGAFNDTLFVTKDGGIGIEVAGLAFVMPLRTWHELARKDYEQSGDRSTEPEVTDLS